jgi:hypothetical protein
MSVISKREESKLILEIDNGELKKLDEVMDSWNFKNEQAFLRFVISVLIETEDKVLCIKTNGKSVAIEPANHSINENYNG